jgi:hypothetical protein
MHAREITADHTDGADKIFFAIVAEKILACGFKGCPVIDFTEKKQRAALDSQQSYLLSEILSL